MSIPTRDPLDLHDPSLPGRLHRAFDELRQSDPVHPIGDGRWLLTRYDDVARFLKDRTLCTTDIHAVRGYDEQRPFGAGSDLERVQEGLLINLPDDDHRRVRGAFTRPFTRSSVESELTTFVDGLADALFAGLPAGADAELDWVAAIARPMPARVFQHLFDLPEDQLEWLLELLHQDTVAIDVLLSPSIVAPADLAAATAAFLDLRREIDQLARARHGGGGGDLLTFLLDQHDAGRLTWDDVLTQAMEALAAGTSTTSTLITGMVEAFATHPEQWELLRTDPSLVRPAVEEALRWVSPALSMGRVATQDFELHGRTIRAGDVIQCGVLPANRDPAVFPDPHDFDITRSGRSRPDGKKGAPGQQGAAHVAFGGGTHTCLGAHVARLEARVVLERLVERYARIELEPGAAVLHPTLLIRTYAAMPVRLIAG